jgi:hypothetical protein
MKKKSIKKLELKKITVVKFDTMKNINGGTGCQGNPAMSQQQTYGTKPFQ